MFHSIMIGITVNHKGVVALKQYVFTFDTNDCQRDLIFNASGIVDAVNQLKFIMNVLKADSNYQTKSVYYKGIIFNNHLL
ncbi:hypothetical protein A6K24_18610 [Metabacillus litoralis]|uniref:Uncharacterized protein n=1 Tax=Metabacillus litoralis TaxID=152268 RepID=A0A179T284_9BACI|nr:hypothetical protein A6K24_18610 [Metabacillus litoralis]